LVEPRRTHVRARITAGAIGSVADTSGPDLEQKVPAIVRVLLHDSIPVTGDVDVVLEVDKTAVQAIRQNVSVSPGVHHIALAVELEDRRRSDGNHILGSD